MKWTVLVLALVLSASISGTNAQGCPDGWAEKSARCYQFFMGSMTFSQAEALCASHNARVALPKDQALNDFIVALRNSNARDAQFPAWIGLKDVDVENEHRWTDGTLLEGYANWADGEPNDAPGEADCVRNERSDADERYRNKWRDYPCDSASFGVFCETLSPCEVDKGTCSASGDPHYTSFDNRRHHFQGRCRYTLAKDCGNNEFTVEAKNEPWGTRPVSVTREIYVIAFGITIGILQYDGSNNRHTVTLDTGNGGGPTYLNSPSYVDPLGRITVGVVGRYVHVRLTDQCVDVYFDGRHKVRVNVPRTYMGNMCGLCGNFNDDASDDLNGQSTTVFGNSHLVDISYCPGGDIGPTDDPPTPCDEALDAIVRDNSNCGRITDANGPFAICHNVVDPNDYFENCAFDMCVGGAPDALCQGLEAYADDCAAAGVQLNWRTANLCPLPCPANSEYRSCMTPCPPTCRDQSATCDAPCVEGCECIADHIWSGDSCVPVNQCGCVDPDTGEYFQLNAEWGTPDGEQCRCDEGGIINCDEVPCDVDGGYAWTNVNGVYGCNCIGDCCDRVLCKASGDPHYCTADQRRHHFQGGCTYTFAKDCVGNDFTVETKNVPSPRRPSVSLVRAVWVYITIDNVTWVICILQRRVVRVNDVTRTLPLSLAGGQIDVKLTGRFVRIELVELCVVILYDGRHQVKVEIPRNYQNRLCGLCGNFNGNKNDDYMLPDGSTAPNWNVFGNAWQTDDDCDVDPPTGDPPTLGPCDPQYSDPCDVLTDTSGPFATCIPVVDPTPYVEDCVYDMCQTQTGICSILETYYDTCMEAGVPAFAWRSQDFCPMDCPANSHYSASASACPATCVNPDAPDNCNVFPEFGEGCVCDEGYRQSGQECVPASQCGCIDVYENYYMIGEQWGTEDGQQCECGFPFGPGFPWITCNPATCNEEDGYSWTLVDGVWGCHCVLPCCDRAICYANGDPHYCTPDGRRHHFQGPCRYVFAKDCGNSSDFTVEVQQVPSQWNPAVSIVRQVFVIAYGYEIKIDQGRVVTVTPPGPPPVTPTITLPPPPAMGKIRITQSGRYIRVELIELCVEVLYDGRHEIKVEIPSNYQNDLCGLCGNYNGIPGDDYMLPDGTVASNWNDFGNSWVTDINTCDGDPPTGEPPTLGPCDPNLSDPCEAIRDPSGPFADCHPYLDPEAYYNNCVFDMCHTGESLCENMETYYGFCLQEGSPPFDWRPSIPCPMDCGANSHYSTCTSPCPATCVDPTAPDSCFGECVDAGDNCLQDCVEGCECDEGYIQSGSECVLPVDCGCTDEDGFYHPLGDVWEDDGEECECFADDTIVCEEIDGCDPNPCDPNAACTDVPAPGTGQVCTCNTGYTGDGYTCTDTDGCNPDPCVAMATCTDNMAPMTGAVCTCPPGYHGDGKIHGTGCTDISGCDPNPCHILATCEDVPAPGTGAVCICPFGYEGDGTMGGTGCTVIQCSPQSPPTNGAVSGGNSPGDEATFTCDPGYYLVGVNPLVCQAGGTWSDTAPTCVDDDECTDGTHNCDVNASCGNTIGSYTCTCNVGFSGNGVTCTDDDECTDGTHNCDVNARCGNTVGSYTCTCNDGFSGNGFTCTDDDECTDGTHNCDVNASCGNTVGSYTCTCNVGFSGNGVTCTDDDECTDGTHNCDVNASCGNTVGSYTCTCNNGFSGNGFTCTDDDECTDGTHNCDVNASCGNTVGSYTCTCNVGFSGNGVTCTDDDECTDGTHNCDVNASCGNTVGSYTCTCDNGFSGDGFTCTDDDECTDGTHNCDVNASCGNTVGSYTCTCNDGFSGNGFTCTDDDECTDGTHNCDVNASCDNTPGSFTCTCNDGFSGNGFTCTDDDECTDGTHNCDVNASCGNTVGSYTCTCNVGFSGNGFTCTDTNGCNPDPCVAMATCTDNVAPMTGAVCTCPPGYHGDGKVHGTGCTDISGCDPNPCHILATCEDVPAPGTGAVCMCPSGYEGDGTMGGTGCTDIDGCDPNPCDANAACTDVAAPGTGQDCSCNTGYEGDGYTCTDTDGCDPNPCDANAVCTDVVAPGTGQDCSCNAGYEGDGYTCTDTDGCDPNPCDANAACADVAAPGTGQDCTCNAGYEGDGYTCTDIDGCAGDPCDANAACTDVPAPGTGQDCSCNAGYEGDGYTCTDIDGCDPNPCDANAACTDVAAPGTGQDCSCNAGYEGDGYTCTDIDGCDPNPCDANAACADVPAPGTGQDCTCNTGYSGDGYTCTDTDGCNPDPCVGIATCTDNVAPMTGAVCTCPPGYHGDGKVHMTGCTDISGCDPNPCVYHATCEDVPAPGTGAVCICPSGYEGDGTMGGNGCTDIDGCDPNPCDPNAACADVPAPGTGQECTCNTGYEGDGYTCTDINGCDPDPCVSIATCEDLPPPETGALCHCPPGYGGDGFMDGTGCTKLTRDDLCVLPGRGICRSCGDPHTTMFDRTRHHFQGPCRYTFAKDCGNSSDFTVEVQHVPVPHRPVVSVVREVYVIAYGYEIGIHQGNEVTVNGVMYTGSIPFWLAMGKIRVRYRGIWVHVRLVEYCVDIFYNGRHCVKVKVTPFYWDRMCGLCGNFNGDMTDDYMLPDGTIVSNWNDFGHSWLVEEEEEENCGGGGDPGPCPEGLMEVVSANDMCGLIMDHYGPFGVCHDHGVDPQDFFDDCVYDMCVQEDIVGLCENLEAYADACEDAGVVITWRTATLCPLPCPPNSHYNPCASPCPATCQDPDAPNNCPDVCVECCECDPGYVMSGPHCVLLEDCGCTDPMTGRYYPLEETWIQNGKRCVCTRNGIVCTECSFDIVFILDRSSSIGPYGMYIAEKYIAHIIRCLRGLDVEVGYIVFDCISKWLISLGIYNVDTTALIPEVKAAEFTGGESRVGNAIYHLMCTVRALFAHLLALYIVYDIVLSCYETGTELCVLFFFSILLLDRRGQCGTALKFL
ncbi:zonadhesin-like [Branchiostoma floridae]|uniref:Zonadhesin-like n=1 Tax=Branchiostoma floridae TaxID=7739 RepID=A0A9J7MX75_BRAFL|nr:zonadhesin-like [Branchiostoma floridae]